jgi:DNA-binding NarL/FixJ family response regulator
MQGAESARVPGVRQNYSALTVCVAVPEGVLRRRVCAGLSADGLSHEYRDGASGGRAPDVVVIARDLSTGERVLDLKNAITEIAPTPAVVVSPEAGGAAVRRVLSVGVRGLVFDSEIETALAPVVRAVAADQTCVPREVKVAVDKPMLSHREREVLKLAVSGRTNGEIAAMLFLAESTVKSHLSAAFNRIGVRSRREAASLILDPAGGLAPLVLGVGEALPGALAARAAAVRGG